MYRKLINRYISYYLVEFVLFFPLFSSLYRYVSYKKNLKILFALKQKYFLDNTITMHPKLDEYLHLYAKFIIMNDYHSIIKLRKLKKPLVRISDGEIFAFLGGNSLYYQNNSDALSIALANVYNNKNIVIGLLKPSLSYINLIMYINGALLISETKFKELLDMIAKNKGIYYSAFVNRPNKIYGFLLWKKIWQNKNVCIITGKEGNNCNFDVSPLFNNVKSLSSIEIPPTNVFLEYESILKKALTFPKDTIFLLGMGSTAKIMLLDLHNNGYKGFDIGQIVSQCNWAIGINKEQPEYFWHGIENKQAFLKEERNKLLSSNIKL